MCLPSHRLCPPLPNRLNYICWLHDFVPPIAAPILDIGTGASCIYPILGHKTYEWNFVASDIDADSLKIAKEIISYNRLDTAITLRHVEPSTTLQTLLTDFYATNRGIISSLIDFVKHLL